MWYSVTAFLEGCTTLAIVVLQILLVKIFLYLEKEMQSSAESMSVGDVGKKQK